MASKSHPPLTPADSRYVGTNGRGQHVLVWPSQSRPDRWHHTYGNDEHALGCSCEAKTHSPARACKHQLAYPDALRHHLGEPPHADPGGATLGAAQADMDTEQKDWILGGKLSPPPWLVAPSDRKRRNDEGMRLLYGD